MKQIIVITEDINKANVNKLILVPKIYGAERDNNISKRPFKIPAGVQRFSNPLTNSLFPNCLFPYLCIRLGI